MQNITGLGEEIKFVKALQSKNTEAYSIFYKHYAAALNGIIGGIVEDKKIREKILSEVLCDIWADIADYEPEKQRLFSWMVRKARLRAANAKLKYDLDNNQKSESSYSHVFNMKGKVDDENEKVTSHQVTKQEMKIFDLVYYKGMTAQKVADHQNLKIEEVRGVIRKVVTQARITFKVK